MSKIIVSNEEARQALKNGVDKLANAVKITLGPKGRNVIIQDGDKYRVTKDGVTVAKSIILPDEIENSGAQILKEVASKTADMAGDGTTTSTLLAQSILTLAMEAIKEGANPMDLKRGIDKAVIEVIDYIKSNSKKIKKDYEKIKQVATISANNDEEIGKLIADTLQEIGEEGVIILEDSKTAETTTEFVEGMEIDRGFLSPHFVNQIDSVECVFENPYILVYDRKISAAADILHLCEDAAVAKRPIVFIAEEVDGEALQTMIVNKLKSGFKVCAVRAPAFGDRRDDLLSDIAVMTGGKFISKDLNFSLKEVGVEDLGTCSKIIITRDKTTIIDGKGNPKEIADRIVKIKYEVAAAKTDYAKEKAKERIANLGGNMAIMYIGGYTEIEMKERKDRIDDAICATRSAIDEGVMYGGGCAYLRASTILNEENGKNKDEKTGIGIVCRALQDPIIQICTNCFTKHDKVIGRILKGKNDFGFNARTEKFENLYKSGVIDSAKVLRCALENAASVATMLLISDCIIVNNKQNDKPRF